jgi:hypothetical protein
MFIFGAVFSLATSWGGKRSGRVKKLNFNTPLESEKTTTNDRGEIKYD